MALACTQTLHSQGPVSVYACYTEGVNRPQVREGVNRVGNGDGNGDGDGEGAETGTGVKTKEQTKRLEWVREQG